MNSAKFLGYTARFCDEWLVFHLSSYEMPLLNGSKRGLSLILFNMITVFSGRSVKDGLFVALAGKSEFLTIEGVGHIGIAEVISVILAGHTHVNGFGLLVIFGHPVFFGTIQVV